MSAPDCNVCGEPDCKRAHDCEGCGSGDAVRQCDRDHLTCDDCCWDVGSGPDIELRCSACDAAAERAADDQAGGDYDGEPTLRRELRDAGRMS